MHSMVWMEWRSVLVSSAPRVSAPSQTPPVFLATNTAAPLLQVGSTTGHNQQIIEILSSIAGRDTIIGTTVNVCRSFLVHKLIYIFSQLLSQLLRDIGE